MYFVERQLYHQIRNNARSYSLIYDQKTIYVYQKNYRTMWCGGISHVSKCSIQEHYPIQNDEVEFMRKNARKTRN